MDILHTVAQRPGTTRRHTARSLLAQSSARVTITRKPLRDEVYRELVERIYRGDLAPSSRVRDAALAAELGVSRTPVREALLRLVREGLIECDMGRGFTVRPLAATEARELAGILSALECLALRSSDIFPDARLAQLEELNGQLEEFKDDPERSLALNDEWHLLLLDGCRNQRLKELIGTLKEVSRRYVLAYMRDSGRVEHATHDHDAITTALRHGDRATAETRLAAHWYNATEELAGWIGHGDGAPAASA